MGYKEKLIYVKKIMILSYDRYVYDIDEVISMFKNIKDSLPEDIELICVPSYITVFEDDDLQYLKEMRKMIDNIIESKEKQ